MPFHVGAYFCMGAYKHDVVVIIQMGAYIHGVLILCGCLLSQFYGNSQTWVYSRLDSAQASSEAALNNSSIYANSIILYGSKVFSISKIESYI